ncbi:MAG: transglutaminase domain-containing protein, partial [Chloroflexi bacterium]|nr:transglutaminase domain-containing protein [Chloroflexota bacterium]
MTPNGVARPVDFRGRLNLDALAEYLIGLSKVFRPSDGWFATGLLTLNLMVVLWSVERANWVPTPSLIWVLLLGVVTGGILARIRFWGVLVFPIGLAVGLLVVVWQLTSHQPLDVASADQLWSRLALWLEAARTGAINIDTVPFAFGIVVATWMVGYLSTWVFFRFQNFWGVFVLGGVGLLSNLTYLPPNAQSALFFWLLTGIVLVARVRSVRRRQEWDRRNIGYDGHLGVLSITDSVTLALVVLLVAFVMPVGPKYGPANEVYEYFRTPLKSFEDDFNRLFAGLPARKPLGYRIWGDVMAFQGTINPTETQVLWVESPVPLYWKARTYGTYTSKGWISDDTVLEPMGWVPEYRSPQPHRDRFETSYAVTPLYDSNNLFAGDQVVGVNRDVLIETYQSPSYTLEFNPPPDLSTLPPKLATAAVKLQETLLLGGGDADDGALEDRLSGEFLLKTVSRGNGKVREITLSEFLPSQPDVLALRSTGRRIKARDTYWITSSVSMATPEQLRNSGRDYPTWAVVKYTQLPDDLPKRVRDKAKEVTGDYKTPYDAAKKIEEFLSTFTYTLKVDPPAFDADGVDHFLKTKRGYSEYFASAMAVMLRAVGI